MLSLDSIRQQYPDTAEMSDAEILHRVAGATGFRPEDIAKDFGVKINAPGFWSGVKQGLGGFAYGLGRLAEDATWQDSPLRKYGEDVQMRNPSSEASAGMQGFRDNPWQGIKEISGSAIGSTLPALIPLVGQGARAGMIGRGLATMATLPAQTVLSAVPVYGGVRQTQDAEGVADIPRAAIAALGSGLVESKFGIQGALARRAAARPINQEMAGLATTPLRTAGRVWARQGLEEGAEELAQQPMQQWGAHQDVTSAEALKDTGWSGVSGVIGGLALGPLAAGSSAARHAAINRKVATDLLNPEASFAAQQEAAQYAREFRARDEGRPAADSWYNDFMAQQFAARNDAAAQAYQNMDFPLSPAQQAEYMQPDMFGGREVVSPPDAVFEDYTGPMAQQDPRQYSLFGYNGAPTPLATLTEDRSVPYESTVTPDRVFSAVDQSTGLRARDSAKAFEEPSGTYVSDPYNGGQERELTAGELSQFQAGDHQTVLDAWREEAGMAAPAKAVERAPKNQLAQRFEASLRQAVADGRVAYEHPIVKDWAASKKTVSEAKSFEMALDDVLNPPIPADAAPQVAAMPTKLAPVQQRVFDHIQQAISGDNAAEVVDAKGVIQYQKIGNALGMKRGSAKVAVDGVMRQIAKQQGKTVDEIRQALAQRSNAVRTTETADETRLGESPAQQAVVLDDENLFGDNQSMSEVESIGGSQSNVAEKSSPATEAYLDANKHVPTAVFNKTEQDVALEDKRSKAAEASRAAVLKEALSMPGAREAEMDWNEAKSDGVPAYAEIPEGLRGEWVLEHLDLVDQDATFDSIQTAQREFEYKLEAENGKTRAKIEAPTGLTVESVSGKAPAVTGRVETRTQAANPLETRAANLREVTGEKQSARLDKLIERYKAGEIDLERLTGELQQLEEQAFPPERGGKGIQYSEEKGGKTSYSDEETAFFKSMGIEVKNDGTSSGSAKKDSADPRNTGRPDADPVAGRTTTSGVSGQRVRARLFRGSTRPLSAGDFLHEALGRSSGNPNATLGVWFTDSQPNASRYGVVNTHQVTLDNAVTFTTSNAPSFSSQQEAAAWAADLKAQGADGAVFDYSDVGGPKEYVVFSPESVEGLTKKLSETRPSDGSDAGQVRDRLAKLFFSPKKASSTYEVVQSLNDLPPEQRAYASEASGRVQAFVDQKGKVWLIADNISAGAELGVFLHDVGVHLGLESMLGPRTYARLTGQVDAWAKQSGTQESTIARAAVAAAERSSSDNRDAEKVAYFVEYAVKAGVNPLATSELNSPIGQWFRTLVAALKSALQKIGIGRFDQLTAQDVVDLAYGAANLQLGRINRTEGGVKFSEAPSQAYARKVATQLAGRTGAMVSDDVTHAVTKLARNFMSLADVVEAAKRKLPSASKWYEAVQNSMAERNRLAQDAEKIAEQAARLSSTQLDAVNAFIARSTVEQKWGYDPGFARKVSVDPEMARAFAALGKDAQAVVRGVFQHGEDMVTKKQEILNTLGIDQLFETSGKLDGPYAPLKRFGNYVAVLKSKELLDAERNDDAKREDALKSDGKHYVVSFFDTMGQARRFAEAHAGKFALADAFEKSQLVAQRGAMPEQTLRKIMAALKVTDGVPAQARQAVEQMLQDMYFQTLDEHNARTSGLRRKNREGYDEDMLRSFLSHARAEANFLSNMKFGGKINDAFYAMQREAKDSSGKRVGQDEFNILAEHYAKNLENKDTPIQDRIMALTSAWQLATSPAYHITNSLQGLMVTVPRLAADFGNYGRAWHHMMEGYRTLAQVGLTGALDLNKVRSAGLREALQRAEDMGVLDVGMDSDLTQFEATRTGVGAVDKMTAVARRAMFLLRKVSRQVEVWNRVSSATAAYNMALENGKSAQEAQDYAVRVLQTTQGDFSRTNAPLVLKKLPKVMTQYKKYQFMMGALYVKAAHDAFAGQSPEIRAIGRRMLAYKMFHASVGAGVLGLPLMNVVGMLFSAAFGDDDEPADLERTLRDAIGDDDVANLLLHGPLTMMGLDMSAKLGEDKIFSVAPYSDFKLDSSKGVAKTVFDVMAGPSGSQLGRMGNGVGFFERGEYYRGLENFMPKGFADAMKAFRVANEGYALNNGDVMFAPDEISGFSTTMSFLGMPTTDLKRMDWLRGQQYELTQFYSDRAKEIQRQYKEAYADGDAEAMATLRDDWMALQDGKDRVRGLFNGSHDALRRQSLSTLLRYPQTSSNRERKLQAATPEL